MNIELQAVPAARRQFAEGEDEVRFQRQGVVVLGVVEVHVHGVHELPVRGGNPYDLPAQAPDQGEIFRLRVADDDVVLRHKEHVEDSHFAEKLLPLSGVPRIRPLGVLSCLRSARIMLPKVVLGP